MNHLNHDYINTIKIAASSIIEFRRQGKCPFDIGVFDGIIPDRLPFDGTIDSYSPPQINANDSVKT